MASDFPDAPAYGEPPLPPYADGVPAIPPTGGTKFRPARKLWIQDIDVSSFYRRRFIISDDPLPPPRHNSHSAPSSSGEPPTYTPTSTPIYTVKNHSKHSSLSPRGSIATQHPDFTIYSGEGDEGPVVATGIIRSNKLIKGIGEIKFFPRASSLTAGESSASARERPNIIIESSGKKHTFELDGRQLVWEEVGPGEQRSEEPVPPQPIAKPESTAGVFSKIKKFVTAPPRTPPSAQPPKLTVKRELTCTDPSTGITTPIATYYELQPIASIQYLYRPVPPAYPNGHMASLEIHDPFFTFSGASDQAAKDLVVATITMILESIRKSLLAKKNRASLGWDSAAFGM